MRRVEMNSVVMIAYFFPPEGNAGVYRPLRFVRHLPSMGWNASVISLDTNYYERYDLGLLGLVPSDTEVIRVRSRDPWQSIQTKRAQRIQQKLTCASGETVTRLRGVQQASVRSFLRGVVRRAEAWCYHPDMAMCWIQPAVKATVHMSARQRPDVIWATAGPVSSFIVAQRVSQRTGVPYVLDFRDAWTITYNEFEARRPAWATRLDRRALYRLLAGAQAVTFRYHTEAECYWHAYGGALDASRIHIIPNGYEGAIDEFVVLKGDKCTILYAGTLSSYRYDTLLQALHRLKISDPARARRLRLLVIGEGAEALADDAAGLGLSDIVETAGPTSYAEIARLQREAHALLVLGRPPTMKGHELFAGAKLFSYLKAGQPIVGVLPPDETTKILHRVGVSTVADGNSPAEIVAVFQQLLDAWSGGTLSSLIPDRAACQAYSAERQTAALVCALEGKPAAEPFVPHSVEIPPSLRGDIGAASWADACRQT
jgi:glycosyltransferase involved in cell wall biosynthesis